MESPRKFNDCYFYYYSTCTKGDNCVFRHEPSALGCETMCAAWQQGKCLDKRCKLRHMELRKNRKQIPCYWETQPGGCRKKHCPFMHKNPEARTDGILPSQPQPMHPMMPPTPVVSALADPIEPQMQTMPAQPVPMLWPHQPRQVVLDSAILNVLPNSTDMLSRRIPNHHEPQPSYGPMPVDPLVVNFEEESDNESAPSSTPTKIDDDHPNPSSKTQELLLLEKIQAETAALYSFDNLPPPEPKVKQNLSLKYDRLSLDEITGKPKLQPTERRASLDFKVLSLEEIRARKTVETTVQPPITLNLRKRKISTQETVESNDGNKVIKVVRSNSIVYKKLDQNIITGTKQKDSTSEENKSTECNANRKRTISEVDIYNFKDDELVDNCYEFKKIKIIEQSISTKPKLIRQKHLYNDIDKTDADANENSETNENNDESDNEVQIVAVDLPEVSTNIDLSDSDVECTSKVPETIDLSEDEESDAVYQDLDFGTNINVPDIVASCQKSRVDPDTAISDRDLLKEIESVLDDTLDTDNEVLAIGDSDNDDL